MRIYINGELNREVNNTIGEAAVTDGPIVIGSQFYDESQSLKGYYGSNCKINGVKISAYTKSAEEISSFYNANKDLTSNW